MLTWPRSTMCVPRGRWPSKLLDDLVGVRGHRAQIAILRAGVDVDDGLHVVVVDHRRARHRVQLHQVAEQLRALRRIHRHGHQIVEAGHAILRRLHGHLVGDAVLRIQPEVRRRLEAAAQRDQHALRHVARVQSHLRDAGAIQVHVQRGRGEQLLHVDIGGAGNVPHPVGDLLRDVVVALLVGADHLHVDRRGQSEVQNLGDDVGRLEEELHAGEALRQHLAQVAGCGRRWDGDARGRARSESRRRCCRWFRRSCRTG